MKTNFCLQWDTIIWHYGFKANYAYTVDDLLRRILLRKKKDFLVKGGHTYLAGKGNIWLPYKPAHCIENMFVIIS